MCYALRQNREVIFKQLQYLGLLRTSTDMLGMNQNEEYRVTQEERFV